MINLTRLKAAIEHPPETFSLAPRITARCDRGGLTLDYLERPFMIVGSHNVVLRNGSLMSLSDLVDVVTNVFEAIGLGAIELRLGRGGLTSALYRGQVYRLERKLGTVTIPTLPH